MTELALRNTLITKLFDYIESRFEYAILHHAERIYEVDDDIDFIVLCEIAELFYCIKRFCIEHECFIFNHFSVDINIYRIDIAFMNDLPVERIELDCCVCNNGNDLLGINTNELIAKKCLINVEGNEFYKISDEDEFNHYINKKAYKAQPIDQYLNYLSQLQPNKSEQYIRSDYAFKVKYFSSYKFKVKKALNTSYLIFKRLSEKPAIVICFMGPDGSGKSTIIDHIYNNTIFNNNYYFHLKPLSRSTSTKVSSRTVDDPHKNIPYGRLISIIKLLYFILQYNIGWLLNVFPIKIKSSLAIFDGYFDDITIDPLRFRYGANVKYAKFVKFFIPRPDIYFVLISEADIIFMRKQEVSLIELKRQIIEYTELTDDKRYIFIEVNRTPNEIASDVFQHILEKTNDKY